MATTLIVLTFDNMDEAEQVHAALVKGKKEGALTIDDAAVVVKDAEGKVQVKNQVSTGTWTAAGAGGLLGLLIGVIFLPIGGIILGLGGGALVAKLLDTGLDGKFVKQVGEEIKPGTSALFVLLNHENQAAEMAILRQFHGKVLQTNLSTEAEENLKRALKDDSPRA
jgi:uncharacterized membrane protein